MNVPVTTVSNVSIDTYEMLHVELQALSDRISTKGAKNKLIDIFNAYREDLKEGFLCSNIDDNPQYYLDKFTKLGLEGVILYVSDKYKTDAKDIKSESFNALARESGVNLVMLDVPNGVFSSNAQDFDQYRAPIMIIAESNINTTRANALPIYSGTQLIVIKKGFDFFRLLPHSGTTVSSYEISNPSESIYVDARVKKEQSYATNHQLTMEQLLAKRLEYFESTFPNEVTVAHFQLYEAEFKDSFFKKHTSEKKTLASLGQVIDGHLPFIAAYNKFFTSDVKVGFSSNSYRAKQIEEKGRKFDCYQNNMLMYQLNKKGVYQHVI